MERSRNLVAILLRHPQLLPDLGEAFGALDLPGPLARLRDAVVTWAESAEALDSDRLLTHLRQADLMIEVAQALAPVPFPLPACAAPAAMPAEAEAGWWHIFGLIDRGRLDEQVIHAASDFSARPDSAAQDRLIALRTAQLALREGDDAGASS